MNKKFAIPMENDLLCEHFGHCQAFCIIEVRDGKIINSNEIIPPEHVPGLYPKWVANYGVTDVIAGGMGQKAISIFNGFHINVYVGAPAKTPKEIVQDFIDDKLDLSANYCNHDAKDHECAH